METGDIWGPTGISIWPVSICAIYINDLPDMIQSDVYLFADETKTFRIITSDTDRAHLQEDLCSMSKWCDQWLY